MHRTRSVVGSAVAGVLALAVPASSEATLIFDNFVPLHSTGTFVGTNDWQGGDHMILPSAGVGNVWTLNSYSSHFGTSAAGTYTNIMATLTVYRTVSTTGVGTAFSDPFGSVTQNIGGVTTSGPGQGADFTLAGLNMILHSGPTNPSLGYGIKIEFSGTGPGVIVPHYIDEPSSITGSSSSQGWFRDLNDDGSLTADEYEVFSPWPDGNLIIELDATATPVPEPTSMIGLTSAFAGLIAFRRRKKSNHLSK